MIRESGTEFEALARFGLDQQCSEHAFVLTSARYMADHARFGIEMRFDLEQIVAAPGLVQGLGAMQYQPFAAQLFYLA